MPPRVEDTVRIVELVARVRDAEMRLAPVMRTRLVQGALAEFQEEWLNETYAARAGGYGFAEAHGIYRRHLVLLGAQVWWLGDISQHLRVHVRPFPSFEVERAEQIFRSAARGLAGGRYRQPLLDDPLRSCRWPSRRQPGTP